MNINVTPQGLSLLGATLVLNVFWFREVRTLRLDRSTLVELNFLVVLLGFLTAKAGWLVEHPDRFFGASSLIASTTGMTSWFAAAGACLGVFVFAAIHRIRFHRVADLVAFPMPLAYAVVRIGCHAGGCCHGEITKSWLSVEGRYPFALLEACVGILAFLLVCRIAKQLRIIRGLLAIACCAFMCLGRSALYGLRMTEKGAVDLGWQWTVLGAALVCGLVLVLVHRGRRDAREGEAPISPRTVFG